MSDGQPSGADVAPATVRRIATICNQRGLHARASARFVKTAAQFDADVPVRKKRTEDLGPLDHASGGASAAAPSTSCELSASGPQAAEAVSALADLIECKFNED